MMAEIGILQWALTGWPGAPGVNTFVISPGDPFGDWEDHANQATSELETVYQAFADITPAGWSAVPTGILRVVEDTTGELVGMGAYTPVDPVTSPVTPAEGRNSRATQMLVQYTTSLIHGGRVVRGRSFLGPIIPAAFDNDGFITEAQRSEVENAYGAIIGGVAGPRLAVWSRPRAGQPGAYGDVVTVTVSPVPAVLRRRRD